MTEDRRTLFGAQWYWFRFARPLPVTIHYDAAPRRYGWTRIYGITIGGWFVGAIRGGPEG